MSAGTKSDFVIYNEQFWGGVVETLQQNTEAFNAASNNALRLVTRAVLGEYERESFLKSTASLISRRDPTSLAAATDLKLTQGELIGVKVNRKIGPVAQSRDAFRKAGLSPEEFSFQLGQQTGPSIAVDYINVALGAVRAAISDVSALQYDAHSDATPTLNHGAMVSGMAKFGDRAARLTTWVMHSHNYFDLMKQQVADKLFEVAGATVYAGTIASFGKPVVVVDSTNLLTSGSSATTYDVLALVENAVEVAESEERDIISQPVTGLENLMDRIQGEYAFNLRVKGCAYDTNSGGINPLDATLFAAGTWDKVVADNKEMPGIRITCYGS